ncbi:NUMOD4 domain-containing protein [Nostoc sp.]|uniref:NUMOD4 domain-containing protein n=1 Tax=Nostoc sp. TaxID=1180 RepID=UPI002FF4F95A
MHNVSTAMSQTLDKLFLTAIPGYENLYSITRSGRVWSHERVSSICRSVKGRWLKPLKNNDGYLQVNLCSNGEIKTIKVHIIVAQTFIGERPEGLEVCHNDGSRTNNSVNNLRYDTRSGNQLDRKKHGTQTQVDNRGEKHGIAKLNESQVLEIRRLWSKRHHNKLTQQKLGEYFGVSQQQINRVVNNKLWQHIK